MLETRVDAFGGGAQVIDLGKRETLEWISCSNWVVARCDASRPMLIRTSEA